MESSRITEFRDAASFVNSKSKRVGDLGQTGVHSIVFILLMKLASVDIERRVEWIRKGMSDIVLELDTRC